MIRQRRMTAITVSRIPRRRSRSRKHSNNVIHITVGLRDENPISNNEKGRKRSIIKKQLFEYPETRLPPQTLSQSNSEIKQSFTPRSNSTKKSLLTKSSKITPDQQMMNKSFDQTGMTDDHHRNRMKSKKKICTGPRIAVSLLIIIIIVVAIILSVTLTLVLKPQSQATPTRTPVLRWNRTGITVAGLVGNAGNTSDQFNLTADILIDWSNNLYIADLYNHRIQKYLSGASFGITIAGNGTGGLSPSQLYWPSRILLDSNENMYISDSFNERIQFWRKGSTNGTTIAGVSGSAGSDNNRLNRPYGIALHPTSGALYISDYLNHRIMSYPAGIRNGTLILGGQGPGTNSTQLTNPFGLYLDSLSNSLLIANSRAHNLVRYVFGSSSWTLVAGSTNGSIGTSADRFNNLLDIMLDPMGNMYVADRTNHRIQFFSNGAVSGTTIAGITGVSNANATTLNSPWAVRLDSQLNMYVADSFNHRIQKFLRY